MEQRQFLEGINRKRPAAWEYLYRHFYGVLCGYSFRITENTSVAEDIVQECFITVWKSGTAFTDVKALRVYFYRAVYHNSLKYLRDKQVDNDRLKGWLEAGEEVEEDYFYQAVEEEVIRKVGEVVAGLPEQQRRVLELSMAGMTVQEVADRLGMTANTVKTHKKRAYAYLKEHLQDLYLFLPLLVVMDGVWSFRGVSF